MYTIELFDKALQNLLINVLEDLKISLDEKVVCYTLTGSDIKLPSNEYALVRGPEVMLTCCIGDYCGQAFTVAPKRFQGCLSEVLDLDLNNLWYRGIFFATLNALFRMAGLVGKTLHCKGDEPRKCGEILSRKILREYGYCRVLHIGYQPGHVEALSNLLGNTMFITDLSKDIIWRRKHSLLIADGFINRHLINNADVILLTGSSIVNKTMYEVLSYAWICKRPVIVYGVSAMAVIPVLRKLLPGLNVEVFCPFAH